MLTHPTLDLLHQLGLAGMAKAFTAIEASGEAAALSHPEWLALLLDQEPATGVSAGCTSACATPDCAIKPPSRTSIIAPLAVSIVRCS